MPDPQAVQQPADTTAAPQGTPQLVQPAASHGVHLDASHATLIVAPRPVSLPVCSHCQSQHHPAAKPSDTPQHQVYDVHHTKRGALAGVLLEHLQHGEHTWGMGSSSSSRAAASIAARLACCRHKHAVLDASSPRNIIGPSAIALLSPPLHSSLITALPPIIFSILLLARCRAHKDRLCRQAALLQASTCRCV